MPRRPTGPDVGPDEGDPPLAAPGRNNGQLSRSTILQTALAIVDRDGVDGLSMRRLSEAVGRDPVMLYRHVANKAAVLDGVAEIVLAQLSVDIADPDWAGQLRTVARDFRQLALAHPNVVPLLVTRPLATPLGQRPPGMLRPTRRRPRTAHLRRIHRRRRPTHLPVAVRLLVRPHPQRVAGDHRATRGNRPRTPPRSAPARDHRIPPTACAGTGPSLLRRRRRTRPLPRSPAPRPDRHPHPPRRTTPNHLSPTRTARHLTQSRG